jgi:chromosome segregation ATPase
MRPETPGRERRPLTAGGLRAVTKTGPGKDAEHFKSILKNRVNELSEQLGIFRAKVEAKKRILNRESELLDEQARLNQEIECLKTVLYDTNETIIRSRLKKEERGLGNLDALKVEHGALETHCDQLLHEKHRLCELGRENDKKLESLRMSLTSALGKLTQEECDEFNKVRSQVDDIDAQTELTRRRISGIKAEISEIERNVKNNSYIRRSVDLENMIKSLETEQKTLEQELSIFGLPVAEQKDHILKFVKDLNARNTEMEALIKHLASDTEKTEEMALAVRSDQRDRSEKYNLVAQKKTELDSLIKHAHEEKTRLDSLIASLQAKILRTSERLSKLRHEQETRPEIDLLASENQASMFTVEQLQRGLEERARELKRLDDVENAYLREIANLSQQAITCETRLAELADVEKIKKLEIEKLVELDEEVRNLQNNLSEKQLQLRERQELLAVLRNQLQVDPMRSKLLLVQDKLYNVTQEIDKLNSRLVDSQFIPEKEEMLNLLRKIENRNKSA